MIEAYDTEMKCFFDGWAFILFLFVTVVFNVFFLRESTDIAEDLLDLVSDKKLVLHYAINFSLVIIFSIAVLFLSYRCSKSFLNGLSFIFWLITAIMLLFIIPMYFSKGMVCLLVFYLLLVSVVSYFCIYRHRIYLAMLTKVASKVLHDHLFTILLIQVLSLILNLMLFIPHMANCYSFNYPVLHKLSSYFLLIWTNLILHYFFKAFISSLTLLKIKKHPRPVYEALSKAFYQLGTVSYAVMIFPILKISNLILSKAAYVKNELINCKIFQFYSLSFLDHLVYFFIWLFRTFFICENDFVFAHLASSETNLHFSVIKSFNASLSLNKTSYKSCRSIKALVFSMNLILICALTIPLIPVIYQSKQKSAYSSDYPLEMINVNLSVCIFGIIRIVALLKGSFFAIVYASLEHQSELQEYDKDAMLIFESD